MDSKQGKRETNRRGEIMLKAVFSRFGEEIELTDELWQYDFGQKIQVTGIELPDVCEVHFQYDNLTETKTVTGYKQEDALIIDIPNEALTSRGIIKLYIYLVSSEEGRTVNVAIMHVNRRMKPEGFEVPEDIDLFHHTLLAANEYMQQTKSAKKSAETAANQAEDAKNAAEAAAGSAQASADEAKTSKENAETAAKVAEAFKTKAETARSEAVRAATESTDAKDSAEKSRAAAEKAKQDAEAAKAAADVDKEAAESAKAKAEAAQKAAENAETEAKKAQTATETAKRETETAKTAVETMQSTVAGYADNANVAKESAETARSEAETAKNDAVQAKDAAEKAKSGTAADREVTEAASKTAQVSAVSAEKSAERAETAKEEIQESADQIQKNTEDIAGLEETVSTAGISVTEAGTEIVVPECTGGKFQGLKLYGKSEQKQYQGTNLLDLRNGKSATGEGVTYTKNEDGSYKRTGTATGANGNVWFAGGYYKDAETATVLLTLKAGKYVTRDCVLYHGTDSCSGNITINNELTITGVRNPGQTVEKTYNDTIYPRINAGSTDAGWEPYVGEKPSPSPDYPQSIDVLGEENITTTIKTSIANYKNAYLKEGMYPEWCENGFIFDASAASSRFVHIPVELKKGKSYIVEYKTENISGSQGIEIYLPDNQQFLKVSTVFQPNTDVEKIALYMPVDKIPAKNKILKFKVYEQVRESAKINISTLNGLPGIPVSSGGNYTDSSGQEWICDEIDFERGMYIQRVGTKVGFDGFQETNSANSDMSLRIVCNMNDIEKVKFTPIICNKLRLEKKSSYTDEGTYISTSETATGRVCVRVEGIKTMEEYQEILADMQYFYILATPIETPLTAEEINAYKSLYT